jgi:hypothetical protein
MNGILLCAKLLYLDAYATVISFYPSAIYFGLSGVLAGVATTVS